MTGEDGRDLEVRWSRSGVGEEDLGGIVTADVIVESGWKRNRLSINRCCEEFCLRLEGTDLLTTEAVLEQGWEGLSEEWMISPVSPT